MLSNDTKEMGMPKALYVWLVPSEEVLEQPGSWRIRKWDTEPFPEANFYAKSAARSAPDAETLLDNAACASQVCELLRKDDGEETVLREAVRMNVYEPLARLISSSTAATSAGERAVTFFEWWDALDTELEFPFGPSERAKQLAWKAWNAALDQSPQSATGAPK